MLDDPDDLLRALDSCVKQSADDLGIRIEQVQVLGVRPTDEELVEELAAEQESLLREQATLARSASEQRVEQSSLAAATAMANQRARAELDKEAYALEQQVALQRKKLEAETEQLDIERARLETSQRLDLLKLDADAALETARLARDTERNRAEDLALREQQRAAPARQEDQLAFELDQTRRRASAHAEALRVEAEAEASKSQAQRDQQIIEHVATQLREAVSSLPLHDVRLNAWSGESALPLLTQALQALRGRDDEPGANLPQ